MNLKRWKMTHCMRSRLDCVFVCRVSRFRQWRKHSWHKHIPLHMHALSFCLDLFLFGGSRILLSLACCSFQLSCLELCLSATYMNCICEKTQRVINKQNGTESLRNDRVNKSSTERLVNGASVYLPQAGSCVCCVWWECYNNTISVVKK